MWLEIVFGVVIYKFFRRFIYGHGDLAAETSYFKAPFTVSVRFFKRFFYGDDNLTDAETSDFNALFSVAARLEKQYGGKAYVGLRVPDTDTGSRQNIDIVLITKGEAVVISVQNLSALMSTNNNGSWVSAGISSHKTKRRPNPVVEIKQQVSILESYLEQRGCALPEGYMSCNFVYSDSNLSALRWGSFPSEVGYMFSGWIKSAFRGAKKEMQESFHQQLNFILSTAPTWDRLELEGKKIVLGEFLEFRGKHEDIQLLRSIRRSKVSRLMIQKTILFGLVYTQQYVAHSKLQAFYSPRDYRNEGTSASEWTKVNVGSNTEVMFQPKNSSKVRKIKLSSIISMTLSA